MLGVKKIKGEFTVAIMLVVCALIAAGGIWASKKPDGIIEETSEAVLLHQYGIDIDFTPSSIED